MVTFKSWIIDIISKQNVFLKINKGGISYSIPYRKTINFFNKENDCLILENLITDSIDAVKFDSIENVNVFYIGEPIEGNLKTQRFIETNLLPLKSIFNKSANLKDIEIIFIDGMNENYLNLMDFMGYFNPEDFKKVHFSKNTHHDDSKKWFTDIVLKKYEVVKEELSSVVKNKDSKIFVDLKDNVDNFIKKLDVNNIDEWEDSWPSLLNPSPYYITPKKVSHDG